MMKGYSSRNNSKDNVTNPVGFVDGAELGFSFSFIGCISIGMPFHNQRFVGLANICKGCSFGDSKNAIQIRWRRPRNRICHHRGTTTTEKEASQIDDDDARTKASERRRGKGREREKERREFCTVQLCSKAYDLRK